MTAIATGRDARASGARSTSRAISASSGGWVATAAMASAVGVEPAPLSPGGVAG